MARRFSPVRILLAAAAVVPLSWPATILGAEPVTPILTASRFFGPEGEDLGAERLAATISRAWRLVPTIKTVPRLAASWRANLAASWNIGSDFSRLMMWIRLRWPKMY